MIGCIIVIILTFILSIIFIYSAISDFRENRFEPLTFGFYMFFGIIILSLILLVSYGAIINFQKCPKCDEYRAARDYCIVCGYDFENKKICKNCEAILPEKGKYCGNCGELIKED